HLGELVARAHRIAAIRELFGEKIAAATFALAAEQPGGGEIQYEPAVNRGHFLLHHSPPRHPSLSLKGRLCRRILPAASAAGTMLGTTFALFRHAREGSYPGAANRWISGGRAQAKACCYDGSAEGIVFAFGFSGRKPTVFAGMTDGMRHKFG